MEDEERKELARVDWTPLEESYKQCIAAALAKALVEAAG